MLIIEGTSEQYTRRSLQRYGKVNILSAAGNLCDAVCYSSTDHQMKLLSSCTPSNLHWLHDLALSIAV